MSVYRELSEPYDVPFEDLVIIEKLLNGKKLTDRQKQAIRHLLKEHYSRD